MLNVNYCLINNPRRVCVTVGWVVNRDYANIRVCLFVKLKRYNLHANRKDTNQILP